MVIKIEKPISNIIRVHSYRNWIKRKYPETFLLAWVCLQEIFTCNQSKVCSDVIVNFWKQQKNPQKGITLHTTLNHKSSSPLKKCHTLRYVWIFQPPLSLQVQLERTGTKIQHQRPRWTWTLCGTTLTQLSNPGFTTTISCSTSVLRQLYCLEKGKLNT